MKEIRGIYMNKHNKLLKNLTLIKNNSSDIRIKKAASNILRRYIYNKISYTDAEFWYKELKEAIDTNTFEQVDGGIHNNKKHL